MKKGPGRPHRLPLKDYIGQRDVTFDACTFDRAKIFTRKEVVDPLVAHLAKAAAEHQCLVPIYCFMPDHLHVMVYGQREDSNVLEAMHRFKLLSGKWLHRKSLPNWQGNFYDHIIRSGEDWRRHATYIALNPVRAGLTDDPFKYPFLGTIGCDLQDVILPWD
jgi:putative transposase